MCWSPAQDCRAVAEAAAKLAGVDKVLLADDAALRNIAWPSRWRR